MILFPNAKINIGLEITSRRPDGYHNLDTIFFPTKWCDILEIVPAKGTKTTLTVTGNKVDCPPEKNLVMRAWQIMSDNFPIPPVNIYLHKIIPDGAGLGGGSSDAAFTLVGLNELLSLGLQKEELAAYATGIGADCPFFIYNKPMRATGIGNVFSPLEIDMSDYMLLIVKPPVAVSTKQAYQGVTPRQPEIDLAKAVQTTKPEKWGNNILNRFEASVFSQFPEIESLKKAISQSGAVYTSMSGSGASVYGIYHKNDADRMSAFAKTLPPGYVSHCSNMLYNVKK
ncbi:MAG: 4-(cytidine 5'-diphospho)-2-C-methyl-D-erythritol kinase [Muribaculum sp.]|nr:4-(cytidine 5'-diphospho)-2-C-methyl-D-erythritol kinase [Muribaculaceae bacterium]MCM1081388.1 4-(cytidine 5'-diphospho)-2-C-methyl-D-erythritol kinase [Muribaculum sp.]